MERERTVNKLVTQVANDTMGGILNSIEYNELSEDELQTYKNMTKEDWYEDIYKDILREPRLFVKGGWIEIKKDIKFLGKEKILEIIANNEYVINCLEELDSLFAR